MSQRELPQVGDLVLVQVTGTVVDRDEEQGTVTVDLSVSQVAREDADIVHRWAKAGQGEWSE